VLRPNQTWLVA